MKRYLLLVVCILVGVISNAQKIKIVEGSVENLIGVTEYNVVFDYSNITIANFDSEEEFLKDKMAIREAHEIGSGEHFKKRLVYF